MYITPRKFNKYVKILNEKYDADINISTSKLMKYVLGELFDYYFNEFDEIEMEKDAQTIYIISQLLSIRITEKSINIKFVADTDIVLVIGFLTDLFDTAEMELTKELRDKYLKNKEINIRFVNL